MRELSVSIITTFRQTDSHRLAALLAMLKHVSGMHDWQVILVEQSSEPTLEDTMLPERVEYKFVSNKGSFNKSWGMNVGMKQSEGDILVFSDADMLVMGNDLDRAVQACNKELDAVRPYGKLVDMNPDQTKAYLNNTVLPDTLAEGQSFDRHHEGEELCFAGGMYVIRRSFYESIGGMDERFTGWGGEDDAMSIKILSQSKRVAVSRHALAWHLWHPRQKTDGDSDYIRNLSILDAYRKQNTDEIRKLCEVQAKGMGRPDKYDS